MEIYINVNQLHDEKLTFNIQFLPRAVIQIRWIIIKILFEIV